MRPVVGGDDRRYIRIGDPQIAAREYIIDFDLGSVRGIAQKIAGKSLCRIIHAFPDRRQNRIVGRKIKISHQHTALLIEIQKHRADSVLLLVKIETEMRHAYMKPRPDIDQSL